MQHFYNTEWAAQQMRTARSQTNGKPLANNTRLFANEDGSYSIKLHNTFIIVINTDGTYTLNTDGRWRTVTTLQRMRTYAPVWSTLVSEKGEWYVRIEPRKDDPKPEVVWPAIPAPFARPDDYEQGDNPWFDYHADYYTKKRQRQYDKMMERFSNNVGVWRTERAVQHRARKAYLKADREWWARNHVPFYDGIVVNSDGYAPRVRKSGPSPAKLRRHEAEVKRVKKSIDKYIGEYIAQLSQGMPMPNGGDCWYCLMKNDKGVVMGDFSGSDHLTSHMDEHYYVPSLAVNALVEAGYQPVGVAIWLDMTEEGTMGGRPSGSKPYDAVRRALRKYMQNRLVPTAPIA